jgi:glycolate oxidase FAD binding subunit
VAEGLREALGAETFFDWGGGLLWALTPEAEDGGAETLRAVAGPGRATLVRAAPALRAAIPPFPPNAPGVAAIERGLRARFDPAAILNPGRMAA